MTSEIYRVGGCNFLARWITNCLVSELLNSLDHVGELLLGLLPLSGLHTAVRVDPNLLLGDELENLGNSLLKLLLGRNSRRVNIKETKTNLVGVRSKVLEVLGLVLLGELNRNNISIERNDGRGVEVRVAEMRVDLGRVLDTGSGDSERINGPLEVVFSGGAVSERETLSDSGLVDLDDVDAGLLEVKDLVSESKSKLLGLVLVGDVVSGERPSETGDGASKHTLHGLLSDGLSVLRLLDGHGSGSRDVTDNDRGSDVSRSVRLDPAVLGENVTVKSLTKVLDHIVSLGLTVHVDVEANLVLELDDVLDLLLNELLVLLGRDLTLGELVSVDSDILGLGERANGGGGEQRQVEVLLLGLESLGESRLSVLPVLVDLGLSVSDLLVEGDGRLGSGLDGGGVGSKGLLDVAAGDGLGHGHNLAELLGGEGEPVLDGGVKLVLVGKVNGGVDKRGSGGDDNSVAELGLGGLDDLDGLGEVSLPDVSAVDDTDGQNLVVADKLDGILELLGDSDKVKVETGNGETLNGLEVGSHVTKVGGDGDLGDILLLGEELVSSLEGVLHLLGEVENKNGLVDLDGLGTSSVQLLEDLGVDGEELLEERDGLELERVGVGLTEGKEGDGADQNGSGLDAEGLGLEVLVDGLLAVELELGGGGEGGSHVVVVGVEPLDHLEGGDIDVVSLEASAHGEHGVNGSQVVLGVSLGDDVEEQGVIENVIVEGEVVGGDDVDASILLLLPVDLSELLADLEEVFDGGLLAPVGLGDLLKLSVGTDSGETKDR